jgi:hypothetical protein
MRLRFSDLSSETSSWNFTAEMPPSVSICVTRSTTFTFSSRSSNWGGTGLPLAPRM